MTRTRNHLILALLLALAGQVSLTARATSASPDYQEVYDLIRQHAAGVSEADLNRAAVQGLLAALGPKVSLATNNSPASAASGMELVTGKKIYDGNIAYLRIARVNDGLAKAVSASYQQLDSTNKVSGLVLDLRYADGLDYKAAAATADLFASKSEPLLNWGDGVVSSHQKTNALALPVGVLVNHETAGAAEALAAMVREAGAGLILGSPTAGEAMVMQDFPLKDGEHLRIASGPVMLGDGSALSAQGIKPDIDVTVSEQAERAFYADAFLEMPATNGAASLSASKPSNGANSSNPPVRFNEAELVREHKAGENPGDNLSAPPVRFNEAELVREHKAGENPDEEIAKRPPEPDVPVVSDPALARALDLLKGLAVVRENNS